jgi:hypothetical protein
MYDILRNTGERKINIHQIRINKKLLSLSLKYTIAHKTAVAACQLGNVLNGFTDRYNDLSASKKNPSDFISGRIKLFTGIKACRKLTILHNIKIENKK